ncbi:hypothetical protein ACOME3_001870 [Neoechinorhynchus agilis]
MRRRVPDPAVFIPNLRKVFMQTLEEERIRKLENDTKIDIVMNQRIFDYDQFSQLVKAADLQPLDGVCQLNPNKEYLVDEHEVFKLNKIIAKQMDEKFVVGPNERIADAYAINPHQIEINLREQSQKESDTIVNAGDYTKKYSTLPENERLSFIMSTVDKIMEVYSVELPPTQLIEDCIQFFKCYEGFDALRKVIEFIADHPRSRLAISFIDSSKRNTLLEISNDLNDTTLAKKLLKLMT